MNHLVEGNLANDYSELLEKIKEFNGLECEKLGDLTLEKLGLSNTKKAGQSANLEAHLEVEGMFDTLKAHRYV
jgi:hypothetical protein